MHHREPRPYAYDDQNATYPSTHMASHGVDYMANNYSYDSSGHYYAAPSHGMGNVSDIPSASSPPFRSMTPSLVSAHRYPTASRDPRYFSSQGFGGSSSVNHSAYAPQSQPYPSQYLPSEHRSSPLAHGQSPTQFIPTPSEIAHSYSNYPQQVASPHSPVHDEIYPSSSLDYPAPHHMVPSSHGNHPHRPSRILTGRARGGSSAPSTSPTSASSPSGERFPCEKCGKTFSRSHDRKRHHETQHLPSPVIHRCVYCQKEFSRADSRKRHLDNGCDEMHS